MQEQYRIFNSAYLAFGPHGTALSNIIWMRCDVPVAVIEFMCAFGHLIFFGFFVMFEHFMFFFPLYFPLLLIICFLGVFMLFDF